MQSDPGTIQTVTGTLIPNGQPVEPPRAMTFQVEGDKVKLETGQLAAPSTAQGQAPAAATGRE
jgi:hypothetical protein